MNEKDKEVIELINIAKQKREKIEAGKSRVDWKTNCSFKFDADDKGHLNLRTVSSLETLVHICAFLLERKETFERAAKLLDIKADLKWMGFSFEDWISDVKSRVNKVQLEKNKADLEKLESRLDKLVSKELRDKMELDAIKAELGL